MYRKHQKRISKYARENPEHFARVLKFVILSIRTRLFNLPADMDILDTGGYVPEDLPGILYGWKHDSINQIDAEAEALYAQAEFIAYNAKDDREKAGSLLDLFTGIGGVGLVKAGFCAQLIYGVSACLDSHNIARFGIPRSHLKSSAFKNAITLKTRWKYIERYCDYVEKCGGTESLWDSWCAYVYERPDEVGFKMNGNKTVYKSAYHVSALHCESLGLAAD